MKVMVIGAGGVIGQHMIITVPVFDLETVFTRLHGGSPLYRAMDLCGDYWETWLEKEMPDVVVNLAGCNDVDAVEANPQHAYDINVTGVRRLVDWCNHRNKYLIHVSSQAALDPVNEYGKQKLEADKAVMECCRDWTIIRPTFVLGIRPFPGIGRENPAERILAGKETRSVCDRFFSISFAWDVAAAIWASIYSPFLGVFNVGNHESLSRLDVTRLLGAESEPVNHDSLGVAQRPLDTTYKQSWWETPLLKGFEMLARDYADRRNDHATYRAKEIAAYLRMTWRDALNKLASGFGTLHNEVAQDFRSNGGYEEEKLLAWYRKTDAYIWELTAYHLDPGFNYRGMVSGIVEALKGKGITGVVVCLGDGTGDLSLGIEAAGMKAVYNDLYRSRIAEFAQARFLMQQTDYERGGIGTAMTTDFTPELPVGAEAVVSLDFLEHVPNVEAWVKEIYACLKPGGYFVAQNAFNMGSGKDGSIPMHLTVNDHYETDWDPLLSSVGFKQLASNWYQKP